MKLCYFDPSPCLCFGVLRRFFSKSSTEPPLTLQAFTHSVVHGEGDGDHTVKEWFMPQQPPFVIESTTRQEWKKTKRGENTIIKLPFCQQSPECEWKRHPPISMYGHFASLPLSESLIVTFSPLIHCNTQSCNLSISCIFINVSEQMIHLSLFIILSPISCKVKVWIMHHCYFQEQACHSEGNDTRRKVWFESKQRVSR